MKGLNEQFKAVENEKKQKARKRYHDALKMLPVPGEGNGLHPGLLGVSNLGVIAGVDEGDIIADLRKAVPHGKRHVSDHEIRAAVALAVRDRGRPPSDAVALKKTPSKYQPDLLDRIVQAAPFSDEGSMLACSPIDIPVDPQQHGQILLSELYEPNEYLFAGERYGQTVKTTGEWISNLDNALGSVGPHIIPNPLTGTVGPTKSGTTSYRADSCVSAFRFAVIEFDDLDRVSQLAFWSSIDLPVAALIDSGGKSIHAWVRVDLNNSEEWEQIVEMELYAKRLIPLGVDPMCRTEARLSRMPGYRRRETNRWQRLLYLAPRGRKVTA